MKYLVYKCPNCGWEKLTKYSSVNGGFTNEETYYCHHCHSYIHAKLLPDLENARINKGKV
jgi:transposase-like protein